MKMNCEPGNEDSEVKIDASERGEAQRDAEKAELFHGEEYERACLVVTLAFVAALYERRIIRATVIDHRYSRFAAEDSGMEGRAPASPVTAINQERRRRSSALKVVQASGL